MIYNFFSATYGCGKYGEGQYQTSCLEAVVNNGKGLVNTGTIVTFVAASACLIIAVALFVRFYRRK